MIITTLQQWLQWADDYTHLPFIRRIPLKQGRMATWEQAWKIADPCSFVLESGKGGRYSMLGLRTPSTIQGSGNQAWITNFEANNGIISGKVIEAVGPPLELVREWMSVYRSPRVQGAPKFVGGCVGYWGYDIARSIERLPTHARDEGKIPDFYWMRTDELWVVDHQEHSVYCMVHIKLPSIDSKAKHSRETLKQLYEEAEHQTGQMAVLWDKLEEMSSMDARATLRNNRLTQLATDPDWLNIDVDSMTDTTKVFSKEAYMEAVREVKRYISQGDVFQVNLSVRQDRKLQTSPEEIYECLRLINPSPYMGFIRFPELSLVSGSPELLVRLVDGVLETRPIAGTRPRGDSAASDIRLAEELINNEKERAEHVMLVDLLRNDLGRIAQYGSVKVDEFMAIEYYSHVMHIVSNIRGLLAEGKQAYDVITSTFPGGTITGAPKVRTMEIIEELEPVRRGPYTGSMGWIDYNGNMELNITIRTMVVQDGMGQFQAGAGIVIDSEPELEYMESLNKAKALWKAIQFSESLRGAETR